METIQIVTTSNDNYAKPTAVMLTSLLENKKSNNPINIYIIGTLSKNNKSKLNNSVKRFGLKINFFEIAPTLFENFKLTLHFTQETYYRLIIPDLLDTNVHKTIYLDGDIILNEDITELWNINIEDYFLAAVNEFNKKRHKALSIPTKGMYFNAGVMVINLDKWRENDISQVVIDYLKNNESIIQLADQDALNAVLHSKWLELDMKWNFTSGKLKRLIKNKKRGRSRKTSFKPAIIHFTGRNKPWNAGHKLQNEYFRYESITIWSEET
ncbi:glycosyltransferase family 8 protein [Neobacillus sp. 179-C4.2 HS]|uniref:Glycosyltransferase family 8 protein n=1 Tax=Neobacillus driksii TaxID=3035913 RepID=A0ABV4YPT0_9BACI|nr:glycosyltransferase family 8 protein [Neobacillus sp. 179.-C4.2 HS]MDP5195478.1 glycosyltransferase family 8 protein [Neobacillus sp. 179.-C4.2 HS]